MGGSTYSSSVFSSTIGAKTAAGIDPFGYSSAATSGAAPMVVHPDLDVSKPNKAGRLVRESRDCDAHPDSVAVTVGFDVTGSMSRVPRVFVSKLGSLMGLLTKKGYLADPHVMFGAIGDAYTDRVPLQVGNWESGNEMDEVLTKVVLEGGGGGQNTESYDLFLYYMARHTEMDCLTLRGKKGYLFILGDELLYPRVNKDQVKRLIGDDLEADIPIATIIAEVKERFELFWVLPAGTSGWSDHEVNSTMSKLFGQSFLKLEDPEAVAELIATTIGVCEGIDVLSIEADLKAAGSFKAHIKSASTALAPFVASSGALTRKVASVAGTLATSGSDLVQRL